MEQEKCPTTLKYYCKVYCGITEKVIKAIYLRKVVIIVTTNLLRVSGLSSGIDTDSIIKQLMQAYQVPIDKLNQNKQTLEWKQEDYRTINTSLRSFRDTVFNMKLQSTYLAKNVSSSDETVLTATAGSNAIVGTYQVNVTRLAEGVSKASTDVLADESGKTLGGQFGLSGTVTFTLTGSKGSHDFSFDTSTKTISDVVKEINGADLGITASYDADQNRFFLNTTTTGADAVINVTNDTSSFLSDTGGTGANTLKLKLISGVNSGQDAQYDFGDATGLTSSVNNVTVNGVTMTLKNLGASTVTVTSNTDAVYNSIVSFIDSYNKIEDTITTKLSETRYSDYVPLTDDQRSQLSDTQIEKWEEKARSGILRNDDILSGIRGKMRSTMSAPVSGLTGEYKSLSDIGITTTEDYNSGQLVIDEDKLRKALEDDPEGIMKLFTNVSDDYGQKGIAARLYEDVNNGMNKIIDQAGSDSSSILLDDSYIGKRISDIDSSIDTAQDRMDVANERYYKQFTAMEQAIQQFNSQSAYLSQMLGGSSSS